MKTGHTRNSWDEIKRHRDRVAAKYEKVQGLAALLATYEAMEEPDEEYIRELKVKLRTAKCNLEVMTTDMRILDDTERRHAQQFRLPTLEQ